MHDTVSHNHIHAGSVEFVDSVLPTNCHPKARKLAEYWLAIHPANALPGRQHFDPVDIPLLLSNLWLVDIQHEPIRFRLRLLGTRIVDYAGENNAGRWVDEKWPNFENSAFMEIARSGEPSWYRGPSALRPNRDYYELERVRLPLARDGKRVDMILALTVFFDRHGEEII
jgi:hypothetical protein